MPARRLAALLATAVVAALLPMVQASPAVAAPDEPRRDRTWAKTSAKPQQQVDGHPRRVNPTEYSAVTLDGAALRDRLATAPADGSSAAPLVVRVPAPTGELVAFEVVETAVMEPALAAKHPEISTYAGRGVDDPTTTVRLDYTRTGFHASVRGPVGQNSWYVDPAYEGDDRLYLSYFVDDLPAPDRLVETQADAMAKKVERVDVQAGEEVVRRTYRLAFATDPTYATYFGSANVASEKVTLVNRINHVYNDDLALELVLVADNDDLNFNTESKATGANGPCGSAPCYTPDQLAGCSSDALSANRIVLGQLVGADSYDVGHLGLGVNGGGLAGLGVVGGDRKAEGCTGLPTPRGDFYAVDYVAHELGHQFSGNHSFNGTEANCDSLNRNPGTSVEPGSGSSVMAYAGICAQDNLQPHSDPYFSQRSIEEITGYVGSSLTALNEVQTVSLRSFENGDSFRLRYDGSTSSVITRGSNYTNAQLRVALASLVGDTVGVQGYAGANTVGAAGFQVTFNGPNLRRDDVAELELLPGNGVDGFVGTTAQGGPAGNGGAVSATGNHAPIVTAPAAKTIPIRTPFTLTGSATDSDDDPLTYSWEQNDEGDTAVGLVNTNKTSGPLFRQFEAYAPVTAQGTLESPSPGENQAGVSPARTFPDMEQILHGITNAEADCPAAPAPPSNTKSNVPVPTVECYAESLPTNAYVGGALAGNLEPSLNFRLTARDGSVGGGGTSYDDVKLTLDKTAGPFLVDTPVAGSDQVTWEVAGTAGLAPNVRILLSVDGGSSFEHVLAESTPNDGAATVTWPQVGTDEARIKVEAVDNYFFDVNNADFSLDSDIDVSNSGDSAAVHSDAITPVTITATHTGDGSDLDASVSDGLSIEVASTNDGTRTWTVSGSTQAPVGTHEVEVTVTDAALGGSAVTAFDLVVSAEDATVAYTGPAEVSTTDGVIEVSADVTEASDGTPGVLSQATVRFTASGALVCQAAVSSGGVAECAGPSGVPDGATEDVEITATLGGSYTGPASFATVSVTHDGTPPSTTINGSTTGAFTLARKVAISYETDGSSVRCRLDGDPVSCDAELAVLDAPARRTHAFTVAGVDDVGNVDPTPAKRTWTRPLDDRAFKANGWKRVRARQAYGRSYLETASAGAKVSYRYAKATKLALVIGGGSRGRVDVLLDGKRVRTLSTRKAARIVTVASFRKPRSGTLTVVTRDGQTVRLDGLGVAGHNPALQAGAAG